ncbi:MAG: sulfur carrier protein ThiS [Bacteroidales bacterium]|nr:sulfur carrier protein ThiS [Bacteroidales bacterium]
MKFILNDREEEMDGEMITVTDMLRTKKFTFRMRIVKINGNLVDRDRYDLTYINDGDNVQMIYLMSGG